MSGLNLDKVQVGDICPKCGEHKLVYVGESKPYSEEYLWCGSPIGFGCDSTFAIKYRQMWQEDINSLACDMHDVMENEFKSRGMKLTIDKSNEIYEKIQEFLGEFGTGDYRNYN